MSKAEMWKDLAHEAFLQLEYLHQRERQHSSTEALLLRLSAKLGLPLDGPVKNGAPQRAVPSERPLAEHATAVAPSLDDKRDAEYICKCGVRVVPHRCADGTDF